jgi:hypothetical protein
MQFEFAFAKDAQIRLGNEKINANPQYMSSVMFSWKGYTRHSHIRIHVKNTAHYIQFQWITMK